jgi:hypothetical protein
LDPIEPASTSSVSDSEFEELKREYFYSLAISAKLNLSMQGRYCNVDASRLFDEVADRVPFKQWHSWLTQRMLDDSMVCVNSKPTYADHQLTRYDTRTSHCNSSSNSSSLYNVDHRSITK